MAAIVDLAGRALWPVVSAVKEVGTLYSEINPATLSGAIDIIVIRQPNGDLFCSPFHVRFGKLKLFRPSEKLVELNINGNVVDIPMKVGDAGEAFFVVKAENPVPSEYATSPIVPATEPPVHDDTLKSFSLTQVNSSADTTAINQLDPTLSDEMNYLHIEESESNSKNIKLVEDSDLNEDQELAQKQEKVTEDSIPLSSSLPVNITNSKSIHVSNVAGQDVKSTTVFTTASSPPWSWQWGGLPERQPQLDASRDDIGVIRNTRILHNRSSTPLLRTGTTPLPSTNQEMMTINEKVGTYLSGIPTGESPTRAASTSGDDTSIPTLIAVNQDIEDEAVCQSLLGISGTSFEFILCSSCGPLSDLQKLSCEEAESRFSLRMLDFENICERPEILMAPTTIYRIYGFYHSWNTAAPIIMSQVLFQKPLSVDGVRLVMKREEKLVSSGWFSWGRGNTKKLVPQHQGLKHKASEPILGFPGTAISGASPSRVSRFSSTKGEDGESVRSSSPARSTSDHHPRYNYAKSLRLSNEQLKSLDLKDGVNTVQFSVFSSFQGKAMCSAKMFLWNYDAKIVISDVDGTITKSDVLGHVFTMVGRDWTHAGVANLYTNIAKNGYHFLYLTSRAIGQASYTREYLANVEQDQLKLPEGPVLLSPDRLVQAFTREVIQRRPQEFKMQCLKDVKRLFGSGASPFYAGFGNRITDAMSYRSVDIPSSRIFTIDPRGEVRLELLANFKTTSYVKLNDTVDHVFPPTSTQDPDFSDFSFWKSDFSSIQIDVPDVSIPIDTIVGQSASGQILPNQGLEEDIHGDVFGDVEEESIASMDLQEHLSAMQNTKF